LEEYAKKFIAENKTADFLRIRRFMEIPTFSIYLFENIHFFNSHAINA